MGKLINNKAFNIINNFHNHLLMYDMILRDFMEFYNNSHYLRLITLSVKFVIMITKITTKEWTYSQIQHVQKWKLPISPRNISITTKKYHKKPLQLYIWNKKNLSNNSKILSVECPYHHPPHLLTLVHKPYKYKSPNSSFLFLYQQLNNKYVKVFLYQKHDQTLIFFHPTWVQGLPVHTDPNW